MNKHTLTNNALNNNEQVQASREDAPRIFDQIQNISLDSISLLLDHTFSAADDLFYDLSKRASSNNEENLYFESMREIRIKKRGLINSYLRNSASEFNNLMMGRSQERAHPKQDDVQSENLSIVEGDKLEIDLAANSMTSRTRDLYKEELYELSIRLDHLWGNVIVNENTNPIDPNQIVDAFVKACIDTLNIDIKVRLILFKLFEKHVLKQLGHLFNESNQVLVEAGILPKVPKNLSKDEAQARSTQAQPELAQDAQSYAAHEQPPLKAQNINFTLSLADLSHLMTSLRAGVGQPNISGGYSANFLNKSVSFYSQNPGPAMATTELSSLLTKSQMLIDRQLSTKAPVNVVPFVVNQLLNKRNPDEPQALEQSSEDIINLVALFFDNILEDENLPLAIKSLVCRLQIPVLKVAIKDPSILENYAHPARKLLNTITEAGMAFDEDKSPESDPLYRKLIDVTQMVNRQFKSNIEIFDEAEQEIAQLLKKHTQRASIVEKRTVQSEEGRNKIKIARFASQNALYEKMRDASLPDYISQFLTSTWLQVLIITHLKHGPQSSNWVELDQLISDIIWLCQDHQDTRSQQRKERLQPDILQRVKIGLTAAIEDQDAREKKIHELSEALKHLDTTNTGSNPYRQLSSDQIATLGKVEKEEKTWDDMSALEKQKSKYQDLSNAFYEKAKNIPVGTWINYFDEQSSKHYRCKLSLKLENDTYIFVNRMGLKSLEKTRRDFAYDLQLKKAKLLDTNPLFERIMNSIVSHMPSAKTA